MWPERTVGQTARHISNFIIDCYRGIKNLELRDLNDINILTGNNNSGKTSVLELLSSLEVIGKVLRCDTALQDKINLYTLYNKEGKSLVRKMSCQEAVKAQEDWGVELR